MKFSIRDLFLVTVIAALVLGWWVDRQVREARVKQLEKALSEVTLYGAPIDWPGSVATIVTDVMPPKVERIPMVTLPDSTAPVSNPPNLKRV
jgi:hypothetical protein